MSKVTYRRDGDIGFAEIDNPPVNASGQAVRQGLEQALESFLADAAAKALVIYGAGRTFVAGADIREFGKPPLDPPLPAVIDGIEACDKPIIAAIHGTALGGGLELALGCHYRVALETAKVGLPEVRLGLIPGAGGTQRLPRLIGVEPALDMITSGRHVPASEAHALGIVDELFPADTEIREAGASFARKLIDEGLPVRRSRDATEGGAPDPTAIDAFRAKVETRARGQLSPVRAVDAVAQGMAQPFEDALRTERRIFMELMDTPQRAALIHAFFGEREVAKLPGMAGVTPREIRSVGIVGAGTMGGGIGMAFVNAGIPVTIVETEESALDRGLKRIRGNYEVSVKRGRFSHEDVEALMARLTPSLALDDLREADLIIEAVFEKMEVKREIFQKLDAIAKPGAILASNTSYLDIDAIASETSRPEDVLGMHFFSPANVMRLLEVVRGAKTADDVLATALAVGKRIGKVAVVSGVCDGFIGNRMLESYWKQVGYMLEDGAMPQEIDTAMTEFGFPMGPLAVGDLAGLDIGYFNRRRKDATRDPQERYVEIADRLYDLGRHGQKTKKGWYDYGEDGRTPTPSPEVEALILEASQTKGIARRDFSADEIRTRALAALANEGARILEEGIAARPVDIDMVWLNGYGFPAHEGGPMFWADAYGLDRLIADIERFAEDDPKSWHPAPLLERLAKEGGSFKEWSEARGQSRAA